MPLTDLQCRTVACSSEKKLSRFTDREGLYLEVSPTGTKSWRLKCYIEGKEQRLTIGRFPDVGLSTARRATVDIKDRIKAGEDPRNARKEKALKLANLRQSEIAFDSFEAVALQQLAVWSKGKEKNDLERQLPAHNLRIPSDWRASGSIAHFGRFCLTPTGA